MFRDNACIKFNKSTSSGFKSLDVIMFTYISYLSHVVGVEIMQIYYLLSCAGGWLSQHCCVVATADI